MISCACGPGRAVLISGRLGGAMVLVAITLLLALKRKLIKLRFQIRFEISEQGTRARESEATPRRCSRGCRGGDCGKKRVWTSHHLATQCGAQLWRSRHACATASARKQKAVKKLRAICQPSTAWSRLRIATKSHSTLAIA